MSAFAEYAVVSRRSLVKVDPELPLDEAALFGCAVLTGVGAVVNTAEVPTGATVAVVGPGRRGVGRAAGRGRGRGAPDRRRRPRPTTSSSSRGELGATDAVNAGEPDAVDAIRAATGGGVDNAFEIAGSAKALDLAYRITRRGGTTVTAGLPHPDGDASRSRPCTWWPRSAR